MRVLMVSKACLLGIYQRKLEEIARFPDVELMVAVPPAWRDGTRLIKLERAHTKGYELVVEPLVFNGHFHLHFYPRLGRRLRGFAPDVVHIDEEPYNFATFHAMWLAKRQGCRALWFSWQNLKRRYPPPFSLFERYNLRRADYAIVGNAGAVVVWREKGYTGPLAMIPQFGVDPAIFTPGTEGHARHRIFSIGYVGRLVPEKGVDVLLEAAAGLEGDWRLQIAGDGPEQRKLTMLAARLGIADRVNFAGALPSLKLPDFYRGLDVLVLPSRSRPNWIEQFGRVLIEAMACGVPVIGSDCGEIPNVIGEAGLLFPEGEASALRERLSQLMEDETLWVNLSRRGRERVETHFTQAHIAASTVAVYRELLRS
ncbi:MAG: glycosyltransferase [Anaerolineae bacterium]|nr:glycosyltransferase [Anaerolineae bacterium]